MREVPRSQAVIGSVLMAICACNLLDDIMQSLLPAIYPGLKADLGLSFGQVFLVALACQIDASIFQPSAAVLRIGDHRP